MKTINVTFEDSEIDAIEEAKEVWKIRRDKDVITWREFVILSAKEVLE